MGLIQEKVEGKTFSLFGNAENSDEYFNVISAIADKFLAEEPNHKSRIEKICAKYKSSCIVEFYGSVMKPRLSVYTENTADHLKNLSIIKKVWDKRLATTEEQYHFYMLEIELVNRLHKVEFIKCDKKIALLPHCLKDLSKECKSAPDNFDYECKGCSKDCYINEVSKLLREHNIHPYIWMSADLKKLFKENRSKGKNLGVLGIACIPELSSGMRKCIKAGIPVVGLPLNANRCGRWFGEFYPNSINIHQLHNILE